jgi:hypothetical protein
MVWTVRISNIYEKKKNPMTELLRNEVKYDFFFNVTLSVTTNH